jgi:hypothetical protein
MVALSAFKKQAGIFFVFPSLSKQFSLNQAPIPSMWIL